MRAPNSILLALAALLLGLVPCARADYATPGTGVVWTMDDLVAASGGVVSGGGGLYAVTASVTISAGDELSIAPGASLTFEDTSGEVGLEVNGRLLALGSEDAPILLTSAEPVPGAWRGIDYRDTIAGSVCQLVWCEIAYADEAVDVFGADIQLAHCTLRHSASKALDISSGDGLITGCTFRDNEERTVSLSLTASPEIRDCHFENNNTDNSSPYPYISIGLQGVNSPLITGNTILGSGNDMSGGISLWNASAAVIEDNVIRGCGYGILCYQTGANPVIRGNLIEDNNINPDTVNWGFGIACNGSNAPIVAGNTIRGHWYGVAAINGGQPNLGDIVNDFPGDDGENQITDNGLGGDVYGFYNNTPLPQMAQNNWWGADDAQVVEDAIFHQPDQASLGLVTYEPWLVSVGVGGHRVPGALLQDVAAHPNPFNPQVTVGFTLARSGHVQASIVDVAGRSLRQLHGGQLAAGQHALRWDGTDRHGRALPSGVYFYRVVAGSEAAAGKLMLVR